MADYGLYKNGEGYSDPTAAEAIKGMAKPGEIYEYKGREVLIVKNQGGYSNILTLSTAPGKDKNNIEVAGRYTTPGRLNYAFNDRLGAMVERLTQDECEFVLREVCFALGFFRKSDPVAESPEESKNEEITAMNADLKLKLQSMEKKNTLLRSMYNELLDRFIEKFGCL